MQKKMEIKTILELANHHATFAVDPALKTEGIIELVEAEALTRFDRRMEENGAYHRQGGVYYPSPSSVTTDPLLFAHYYVDFLNWRKDQRLELRYTSGALQLEQISYGADQPSGGRLHITITEEDGKMLELSPKKMIGPSFVVVAYVHERPLAPFLPAHSFPVASVEELKW